MITMFIMLVSFDKHFGNAKVGGHLAVNFTIHKSFRLLMLLHNTKLAANWPTQRDANKPFLI